VYHSNSAARIIDKHPGKNKEKRERTQVFVITTNIE
jgi:hypothetical protein